MTGNNMNTAKSREKKKKEHERNRCEKINLSCYDSIESVSFQYLIGIGAVIVSFFPILAYASFLAFIRDQTESTRDVLKSN